MNASYELSIASMKDTSIIGIDVASNKLDVGINHDGVSVVHTIDYTDAALTGLLDQYPDLTKSTTIVGLESTGDYHLRAARFFLDRGFSVKLLNPLLTKQYTRTTIRGTKTDKTDAELITKLIAEGHGGTLTLADIQNGKKELIRIAQTLTKTATQLTLRLQSTKRKDLDATESMQEKITALIGEIKQLADEAVQEATENRSDDEVFIDSIPGFATKLSAIVHHEIGDIQRFTNSRALVAFAGLDPRIKQSGELLNTTGRITKRGSSYLRAALYLAANSARMHDTELNAYYVKKKNEGRSHREVLCMISRKLLARIYSVLKERRPYVITT